MKAKEYAELWKSWEATPPTNGEVYSNVPEEHRDGPTDETGKISFLCGKLLSEYNPIANARKAKTPEALESILKELIQKYEAICRRVDGLPSGFFRKYIDIVHKDVLEKKASSSPLQRMSRNGNGKVY